MSNPRIAVLGAGANGGSVCADLVRAGHDVTIVEQWPAHVEAIRAHGLTVRLPDGESTTSVRALHLCEVATLREPFDLVFLAVKAYDTRWSCELIAPVLAPDGVVVALQNGMTDDAVAAAVGAERSLAAVVENAANIFEPGVVVRQTPRDGTWFAVGSADGASAHKAEPAAEILRAAGTVEVSADILSAKWMKLVGNAAEFLPTAILDLPMVAGLNVAGIRELADAAGREALDTALALGHQITPLFGLPGLEDHGPETYAGAILDAILSGWALEDTRVALLQDWMKGRRGEGEDINGRVVADQARLGGQAPVNEVLLEFSRQVERGELVPSPANADLLLARVREVGALAP
jgi:2-dehydropantoate 2-reductase